MIRVEIELSVPEGIGERRMPVGEVAAAAATLAASVHGSVLHRIVVEEADA